MFKAKFLLFVSAVESLTIMRSEKRIKTTYRYDGSHGRKGGIFLMLAEMNGQRSLTFKVLTALWASQVTVALHRCAVQVCCTCHKMDKIAFSNLLKLTCYNQNKVWGMVSLTAGPRQAETAEGESRDLSVTGYRVSSLNLKASSTPANMAMFPWGALAVIEFWKFEMSETSNRLFSHYLDMKIKNSHLF